MARHTAWILGTALLCAAPAVAGPLSDGKTQGHQQKATPRSPAGNDSQDRRPWKFWQGKSQEELAITAQQSADIEQIFQSTLPRLTSTTQKIHKLEETLSQTIKDNTADLATVSQQVDRLAAARSELYKTRTLMLYRMHGVLSADQRARLKVMVDRWEAERKKTNEPPTRR